MKKLILFIFTLSSLQLQAAVLEMKSCIISPGTLGWREYKSKCGPVFIAEVLCTRPSGLSHRYVVACEKKKNQKEPEALECYNEFMDRSKIITEPTPVKPVAPILGTRG